jgi:two-component system, cell cycle response regulator
MKLVVLVIDDNSEIIDFIQDILSEKYTVLSAPNGQKALDIIGDDTVHLVISDIMMPVMNGLTFCQQLKSDVKYSHIPVILLTAKKSIETKIEGLEIGADAYIEKPFSPRHLLAQVENLLSSRQKLREYFASSPLAHISTIAFSKANEEFLDKITRIIQDNLKNPHLDVEFLAKELYMSRATLYRKISEICNLSPNELITVNRLKKAAEFLVEGKLKMYEISELVGFSSAHHFGRAFLKQFKMTATEFQSQSHNPL